MINYEQLSKEEKDKFTGKWLSEVINIRLLYKIFLETFLNQPYDDKIRKIKKVKLKYFEIDEKTKKPVKNVYQDLEGIEYYKLWCANDGDRYVNEETGKKYIRDRRTFKAV